MRTKKIKYHWTTKWHFLIATQTFSLTYHSMQIYVFLWLFGVCFSYNIEFHRNNTERLAFPQWVLHESSKEQMHNCAGGICSPGSRWEYREHVSRAEDGTPEISSGVTTSFRANNCGICLCNSSLLCP